jgi:hypothetical protein
MRNHLTINSRLLGAQARRRKRLARHGGRLRSARSPDGNRPSARGELPRLGGLPLPVKKDIQSLHQGGARAARIDAGQARRGR